MRDISQVLVVAGHFDLHGTLGPGYKALDYSDWFNIYLLGVQWTNIELQEAAANHIEQLPQTEGKQRVVAEMRIRIAAARYNLVKKLSAHQYSTNSRYTDH